MEDWIIEHISSVLKHADEKYNINCGGCGMAAIQITRFLKTFGYRNVRIRANFKNPEHREYTDAEHYSVILTVNGKEYELNPPKFVPNNYRSRCLEDVEAHIYFLKGNCDYDHSNDIFFYNALWKI